MTPYEAYQDVLIAEKRLPELEPFILKNVHCSYRYAKNIIKGRWKEAEAIIIKDSGWDAHYAYYYAKDVLKWRIKNNKDFYISAIPVLWDKFPKNIKNCPDIMIAYFKEAVLK